MISSFKKQIVIFGLILAALLPCTAAQAWNDTGHMVCALIAYRNLDDDCKQKVTDLLRQHPHYKLFLTAKTPQGVSPDEWAFLKAATWPDFVRPSRPGDRFFKDATITHFHHGPWHYIDIPFVPDDQRDRIDPTTRPSQPEPQNILTALDQNTQTLRSPDSPAADKAVALAWIEHLVQDLHQPLHACTLYSAEYPDGDKGGNELAVRADGNVMRLHGYWDELIGTSDAYLAIDFTATQIANDPLLSAARLEPYLANKELRAWAAESHDYAVALVYLNGRLRAAPYLEYQEHRINAEQVPALPPSYTQNARELARFRIALAGYRLAQQIKLILKS